VHYVRRVCRRRSAARRWFTASEKCCRLYRFRRCLAPRCQMCYVSSGAAASAFRLPPLPQTEAALTAAEMGVGRRQHPRQTRLRPSVSALPPRWDEGQKAPPPLCYKVPVPPPAVLCARSGVVCSGRSLQCAAALCPPPFRRDGARAAPPFCPCFVESAASFAAYFRRVCERGVLIVASGCSSFLQARMAPGTGSCFSAVQVVVSRGRRKR